MYKNIFSVQTLNRGEKMKKMFLYSGCAVAIILMLSVLVVTNSFSSNTKDNLDSTSINENLDVEDAMNSALESVVKEVEEKEDNEEEFTRPYTDKNVKIVSNYYDYKGTEKNQINALTYYNGTYMQSKGIGYSSSKAFDVLAVKSGTVTEILKDELVGNQITIKHDDNTYSIYQSVTNIKVKEGESVTLGSVIATSNTSTIRSDLKNHLYFELVIDGVNVNPEECFK